MTCKYRHRHGQRLNGFHIWPYGVDGVAVSIVRFNTDVHWVACAGIIIVISTISKRFS